MYALDECTLILFIYSIDVLVFSTDFKSVFWVIVFQSVNTLGYIHVSGWCLDNKVIK